MTVPAWLQRLSWLTWPVALLVVQQFLFPAPAGSLLAGVVLGLMTCLVSLGMYLVYRANRVLNFAAGELGLLPAVLAVMLIVESGLSWYLSLGIGLVASAVLGIAVEFLIIRRFFSAPRLVVTVASIGVAQLLAVAGLFLPGWWGTKVQSQRIDAPFDIDFEIGSRTFNANHVVAMVFAPVAIIAVGALFVIRGYRLDAHGLHVERLFWSDRIPLDESFPLWPSEFYGAHKLALEKMLVAGAATWGINASVWRIGLVLGDYPDPSRDYLARFLAAARETGRIDKAFAAYSVTAPDVATILADALGDDAVRGRVFHVFDRWLDFTDLAGRLGIERACDPAPEPAPPLRKPQLDARQPKFTTEAWLEARLGR